VELIQLHGGDVLKFAGDALIVAFGNSKREENLTTKVLRATQCGLGS
jgi:class 3 adenylate cyclase